MIVCLGVQEMRLVDLKRRVSGYWRPQCSAQSLATVSHRLVSIVAAVGDWLLSPRAFAPNLHRSDRPIQGLLQVEYGIEDPGRHPFVL